MRTKKFLRAITVAAALLIGGGLATAPATAAPATAAPAPAGGTVVSQAPDVGIARTADGAIKWFKNRNGSTAYEGYCERAVRLAWDRDTRHASAIDHWNSSDGKKHTTGTPPKGAFVFWNISEYGHVGIADGNGGFWATNVNNKIGHAKSLKYFSNYLGWKKGNSN
ncbi:MAG: hypothetical protein GEU98_06465 [Pseudonocardiaceae bacterium]|nr:hypothetical protein [Pseudonocardiaceae bacterium]